MQLSFTNKVSTVPQFLSFDGARDDKPRKATHDTLLSSGFMTIPTTDSNKKPHPGLTQVCRFTS